MGEGARRRKVLFVPKWYPSPDDPVCGVFVREHALAAQLHADVAGLYVRQVERRVDNPSSGTGRCPITDELDEGIRTLRVDYRRSPIPLASRLVWLWLYRAAAARLERTWGRPDVIHAHVFSVGLPAALLGRRFRAPVVLTEHWSHFPRRLLGRARTRMARAVMARARIVLPVSHHLQRHIEAHGIRARFRVVPNAIDTELFFPAPGGASAVAGAPVAPSAKKLLLVGLLKPVKGVPYLLEALHALRRRRQDFVLDIVGDGAEARAYRDQAARLGLTDIVRFHGAKTKPEVATFMRACDVFVLPSFFETFGVTAVEAIASGTPVVVSDVGGLREIVTDEVGYRVPPANARALADALDRTLDRYQTYSPQRLADHARARYGREVVGHTLQDVYATVLRETHQP